MQDVALNTSVDVASCHISNPLRVCYVKSARFPSLSHCFLKNILHLLLQLFLDAAKLCLYRIAHPFHCNLAFIITKNFHSMNHLLLVAIYAKDRARNAVFLTLLYTQRGFLPRSEFSHRLRMQIGKIICFRAHSLYQFAVIMINLQYPNNPVGSLAS